MARKTIFDIYNEQHANDPLSTPVASNPKEVISTPTEEVQPEKVSVQPEVQNTQPITTPADYAGSTSLNERSGDNVNCNDTALTVSAE